MWFCFPSVTCVTICVSLSVSWTLPFSLFPQQWKPFHAPHAFGILLSWLTCPPWGTQSSSAQLGDPTRGCRGGVVCSAQSWGLFPGLFPLWWQISDWIPWLLSGELFSGDYPSNSLQRFPLRRVTATLQGMSYNGKFTGVRIYFTRECDFLKKCF